MTSKLLQRRQRNCHNSEKLALWTSPTSCPSLRTNSRTMRGWRNGRRARFRIWCRKAWGFKSPLSHHAFSAPPDHRWWGRFLNLLLTHPHFQSANRVESGRSAGFPNWHPGCCRAHQFRLSGLGYEPGGALSWGTALYSPFLPNPYPIRRTLAQPFLSSGMSPPNRKMRAPCLRPGSPADSHQNPSGPPPDVRCGTFLGGRIVFR